MDGKQVTIKLHGKIDSGNIAAVEKEILSALPEDEDIEVVIDAGDLMSISSAGLRTLLHIRNTIPKFRVMNVNPDVYETFDITGFTEMFPVERAIKSISIEDCEYLDRGAKARIYKTDTDNIVKVYEGDNTLGQILHERKMAKIALILGIPTAISYDVVKVGDSYGSVFEKLNAVPFSRILARDEEMLDRCVEESVRLLRQIHQTEVPPEKLPDARIKLLRKIDGLEEHLPVSACNKLREMIKAVPFSDRMLHGDYHTKNIMRMNDEVFVVDMESLATGHPVFEFARMFNAYIGFSETDHEQVRRFQGFGYELSNAFWKKTLKAYFETDDEAFLRDVEDKSSLIGHIKLLHYLISHKGLNSEEGRKQYDMWRSRLVDLIGQYDSVVFDTV